MLKTLITFITCLILLLPVQGFAGRLFFFGLDETGSYGLRDASLRFVENLILKEMEGGDTFVGRRIGEKSYLDTQENFLLPRPLTIPAMSGAPKNRFNVSAQQKYKKQLRKVTLLRYSAVKYIRELKPVNASMTDILGFLAACADRMELANGYEERIILIASDMQDNVRRKTNLNLRGAQVIILAFEGGADPEKTKQFREKWANRLISMNASSVVYLAPDQELQLALVQPYQ